MKDCCFFLRVSTYLRLDNVDSVGSFLAMRTQTTTCWHSCHLLLVFMRELNWNGGARGSSI